ncbi:hypothetical protein D3C76_1806060 [compost metagenome]
MFYRVLAPQLGLRQGGAGHSPEAVTAQLRLGVVTHQAERLVHGVLGHRLPVVVVASKHQIKVPGDLLYLL